MKKKVMISSIGSPAGISVVKLIDKAKYEVHGVNSSIPHVNESLVDFFHLVPRINDVNYIEEIKKLVLTHDIDIFVPTIQPDLNKVKELREFVDVLTVSNDVLNLLLDKELMYEFFEVNGLSSIVPKYRRINRNNYIKLDQLFDKPYILKPTKEHMGGQGFKSLIVEEEEN